MNTLIVVTGPTAVGKTAFAIGLARRLGTEIINADSRQIYADIPIVTAQPSPEERAAVKHHLLGFLPLTADYSAWQFEHDALDLLTDIFDRCGGRAIVVGGSMMYVDALRYGIDPMPDIDPDIRAAVLDELRRDGLAPLLDELQRRDPEYFTLVDKKNPRRVAHAVEICRQTGATYTALRRGTHRDRPFRIVSLALNLDRNALFGRINRRVLDMVERGLEDEARRVAPLRGLNALNTVGLKEMFAYFDGTFTRDQAIARIQKNTRVYAKKQLTWLRRDPSLVWLSPDDEGKAIEAIEVGE